MRPGRIAEALKTLVGVRQPTFLWGAPGLGKSQVVAQVARDLAMQLIDVRAVLLDPVDLRGIPRVVTEESRNMDNAAAGRVVWCPPAFLPHEGRGLLFLDELNTAPPLVQAACYQLILDRRLGEYALPEGWAVVAAGNRESDRAVTHRMPSALANRLVHLDFEADLTDWLAWAEGAGLDPRLRAFLRFRPSLLHAFDSASAEKAFPSPRSWEFAARILAAKPASELTAELLTGAVGQAAALECAAFLKIYEELPEPEAVLADPANAIIPADPAVVLALCESVARRAAEVLEEGVAERLSVLAARLPAEFGVLLMREAAAARPEILESTAFQDWACANSELLV